LQIINNVIATQNPLFIISPDNASQCLAKRFYFIK
jgi:hypothetical protein